LSRIADTCLERLSFVTSKYLDRQARICLPSVTLFQFPNVVVRKTEIERAGGFQFDVDASFFAQVCSKPGIHIAAATSEIKEIVGAIGFCLWREHSGRSRRRFCPETCTFDDRNIAHTAACQLACDGESNHTTADDYDI
jgi:hypothetical protein